MAINVYKWTDADAPVLSSGAPGALANLLRKCLVDGYGSGSEEKAPAGWTMDWDSDTNARIALLPGAVEAQGCYYYFDDTGTTTSNGKAIASIWMSESWDGWDSNGDPVDTALIPDDTGWGRTIHKSPSDTNTDTTPWIMIASSFGFYILIDYQSKHPSMAGSNAPALSYFGKGLPLGGGDEWLDLICGGGYDTAEADTAYAHPILRMSGWTLGTAPHALVARRTFDGAATNQGISAMWGVGNADNYDYPGYHGMRIPYPDPVTGGLLTCEAYITEGDSAATAGSPIRGRFPGMRWPLHNKMFDNEHELTIDGRAYVALTPAVNTDDFGMIFIDIDGPWE